jgi:threonine/homoserine/homoserine lactone efflux protein
MENNKTHNIIAIISNVIIVAFIIFFVTKTNSDKSPIIFAVLYPLLIILNLLVMSILLLFKSNKAKIYRQILIVLLLFSVPGICIVAMV